MHVIHAFSNPVTWRNDVDAVRIFRANISHLSHRPCSPIFSSCTEHREPSLEYRLLEYWIFLIKTLNGRRISSRLSSARRPSWRVNFCRYLLICNIRNADALLAAWRLRNFIQITLDGISPHFWRDHFAPFTSRHRNKRHPSPSWYSRRGEDTRYPVHPPAHSPCGVARSHSPKDYQPASVLKLSNL